jgi:hypothetical protein
MESAKSSFHGLDGPDENCEADGDGVNPPKPDLDVDDELERSSAWDARRRFCERSTSRWLDDACRLLLLLLLPS